MLSRREFQGRGQMGFAHAGRTKEHYVFKDYEVSIDGVTCAIESVTVKAVTAGIKYLLDISKPVGTSVPVTAVRPTAKGETDLTAYGEDIEYKAALKLDEQLMSVM